MVKTREDARDEASTGNCYVFDEQLSVRIDPTDEHIVVGKCHHCGEPIDRYVNCKDDACHYQHLCCEACEKESESYCSTDCREHDMAAAE